MFVVKDFYYVMYGPFQTAEEATTWAKKVEGFQFPFGYWNIEYIHSKNLRELEGCK